MPGISLGQESDDGDDGMTDEKEMWRGQCIVCEGTVVHESGNVWLCACGEEE